MAHEVGRFVKGGCEVLVFTTKEESHRFLCRRFGEMAEPSISTRGFFAAALSGGNTPVGFYAELAHDDGVVDWRRVHVFLVDERFVPPMDTRSNFRTIRETLLDVVPIPTEHIHAINTSTPDPSTSARLYEESLRGFFGSGTDAAPRLDFILLGLGEDGHTASLFPGSAVLSEKEHLVSAVAAEGQRLARVTLTMPAINGGRHVAFLVTGTHKAEIVKRLVEEEDPSLPATRVRPGSGDLTLVCDGEAAALVRSGSLATGEHGNTNP